MDDRKRNLKGSELRDIFKWAHKRLKSSFYTIDADMVWVSKNPPGIVAYVDYKHPNDCIGFAEVLAYNEWICQAPVFIVESANPANGPFRVFAYRGGDWRPDPPVVRTELVARCANWAEFERFEAGVRAAYRKSHQAKSRAKWPNPPSN